MANVNECVPLYEPGDRITARATADITGKRFVKISADAESGPALNSGSDGGLLKVAPCGANQRGFGVAAQDVPNGGAASVIRGAGAIVPVTLGADLAAGTEVASDGTGKAVAFDRANIATKVPLGYLVTGGTNGNDGFVSLYA